MGQDFRSYAPVHDRGSLWIIRVVTYALVNEILIGPEELEQGEITGYRFG